MFPRNVDTGKVGHCTCLVRAIRGAASTSTLPLDSSVPPFGLSPSPHFSPPSENHCAAQTPARSASEGKPASLPRLCFGLVELVRNAG